MRRVISDVVYRQLARQRGRSRGKPREVSLKSRANEGSPHLAWEGETLVW